MKNLFRSLLLILLFLSGIESSVSAQKFTAYFKYDTIRINSSSAKSIDTTLHIIIPKGQSLSKGKIIVKTNKSLSTTDLKKLKVPISNEYKIGALEDTMKVNYDITFPRDSRDDRTIGFELKAEKNPYKRST